RWCLGGTRHGRRRGGRWHGTAMCRRWVWLLRSIKQRRTWHRLLLLRLQVPALLQVLQGRCGGHGAWPNIAGFRRQRLHRGGFPHGAAHVLAIRYRHVRIGTGRERRVGPCVVAATAKRQGEAEQGKTTH